MTIPNDVKIPMLKNFYKNLQDRQWRFTESKEKDRVVLEDFPTVSVSPCSLFIVKYVCTISLIEQWVFPQFVNCEICVCVVCSLVVAQVCVSVKYIYIFMCNLIDEVSVCVRVHGA